MPAVHHSFQLLPTSGVSVMDKHLVDACDVLVHSSCLLTLFLQRFRAPLLTCDAAKLLHQSSPSVANTPSDTTYACWILIQSVVSWMPVRQPFLQPLL